MANFVVTFRLHSGIDYSQRWSSVVDKINEIALDTVWDETSSFFAFKANGTAKSVCDAIYFGSSILDSLDKLVVFETQSRELASVGLNYPLSLKDAIGAV